MTTPSQPTPSQPTPSQPTPSQPETVASEGHRAGAFAAVMRLFLLQLLAVVAVTALLTTFSVLSGRDTSSDEVSTAAGQPSSTTTSPTVAASSPAASPTAASSSAPASTPAPPSASATTSSSGSADPGRPEVVVLNQSAAGGAGQSVADLLGGAGWTVNRVDSFRGTVRTTTVYYPPGLEAPARTLASRVPGKTRVLPRFSNLSGTRLTVVLTDDYTG